MPATSIDPYGDRSWGCYAAFVGLTASFYSTFATCGAALFPIDDCLAGPAAPGVAAAEIALCAASLGATLAMVAAVYQACEGDPATQAKIRKMEKQLEETQEKINDLIDYVSGCDECKDK